MLTQLLPNHCVFCQVSIPWQAVCCAICDEHLPRYNNKQAGLFAAFRFEEPISQLIHLSKFAKKLDSTAALGKLTATVLSQHIDTKPEAIIPVPLHSKRLRERGFNQAQELAKPLAKQLNIPLATQCIERVRYTQAQSQLSAEERQSNLQQAFHLKSSIPYQHIALFDDVITTGTTINTLKQLLETQDIQRIDLYCCAKTHFVESFE